MCREALPDRVVTGEGLLWLRAIAYAACEIVGAFETTLPATILIVDDEQASRSSLSEALIAEGHHVIEAASGDKALQVLRGQQIELALLSEQLSDKSGAELCREIKGDPELGRTFVILAAKSQTTGAQARVAGADGCLPHPKKDQELCAWVQAYLRVQRAEAELRSTRAKLEHEVQEQTAELRRMNTALQAEVVTRQQAEEIQRRYAMRLEILHSMDQAILSARSPEDIAVAALSRVRGLLPHEQASVWEIDERQGLVTALAADDCGQVSSRTDLSFPLERLSRSRAFQSSQPYRLTRTVNLFAAGAQPGKAWQALIDLPLIAGDQLIGVLNFTTDQLDAFTREHQEIAQEIAAQLAVALQQARLFEQVLTGREHLRALSLRLVEVQEAERRYIARELHDEIGQMLTGLKLQLDLCERQTADSMRKSLGEARELVSDLLNQVRKLSLDLRPQILDDLGLLAALDWHIKRFSKQTALRVDFKHELPPGRLPGQLETAIFRIVQEALTNVARHAGTNEAQVRLWVNGNRIGLRVADQGRGFEATKSLNRLSSGLVGMRERANLVGGEFLMESSPGRGTTLSVELPLQSTSDQGQNRSDP